MIWYLIDEKAILQVNATMIAGLLILLTISSISNTTTAPSIIAANRLERDTATLADERQQLNQVLTF